MTSGCWRLPVQSTVSSSPCHDTAACGVPQNWQDSVGVSSTGLRAVSSRIPQRTEAHGKATRVVPIFQELMPYFQDAYDLAPDGEDRLFSDIHEDSNLRTETTRILKRAGITDEIPRFFQNCRSSRQTELEAGFPLHVVCKWLGNEEETACLGPVSNASHLMRWWCFDLRYEFMGLCCLRIRTTSNQGNLRGEKGRIDRTGQVSTAWTIAGRTP